MKTRSDSSKFGQKVAGVAILALTFIAAPGFTEEAASDDDFAGSFDDGFEHSFAEDQGELDRWESYNRAVFKFNMTLDRWLLKPVAKGYDFITPDPVQVGIGNVFSNIGEVGHIANDVLQWRWKQAANDTGRLLTNTTLGFFGLFDVATELGLPENEGADVGLTLARWGVPSGPYLVLPFLGPSTVRDGFSLPVDYYVLDPISYVNPDLDRYAAVSLRFIDQREQLFEVEELASGDLYIFVRDAYLQRRAYLESGESFEETFEDDFGEDF